MGLLSTAKIFLGAGSDSWWLKGLLEKRGGTFTLHIYTTGVVLACLLSCSVLSDSATPWTVALQAPMYMEFSRQEYCSGFPFPTPVVSGL